MKTWTPIQFSQMYFNCLKIKFTETNIGFTFYDCKIYVQHAVCSHNENKFRYKFCSCIYNHNTFIYVFLKLKFHGTKYVQYSPYNCNECHFFLKLLVLQSLLQPTDSLTIKNWCHLLNHDIRASEVCGWTNIQEYYRVL